MKSFLPMMLAGSVPMPGAAVGVDVRLVPDVLEPPIKLELLVVEAGAVRPVICAEDMEVLPKSKAVTTNCANFCKGESPPVW